MVVVSIEGIGRLYLLQAGHGVDALETRGATIGWL